MFTFLPAQQRPIGRQRLFAFIHVSVIDVTAAAANSDMTVLISGERIAAIGETGKVDLPQNALEINVRGKFLIPGLWDMHTHTLRSERRDFLLPLFVANGVTGVRDMGGGNLSLRDDWRNETEGGVRIGPRIVGTGPILDGPLPLLPGSLVA